MVRCIARLLISLGIGLDKENCVVARRMASPLINLETERGSTVRPLVNPL